MLSVCMIVKNEANMLLETLPSVSVGADELIVVDTGSADDTIAVAESFGAKVIEFPWNHDFAAARNASIKTASQNWILWLDADEFVRVEDFALLKAQLTTLDTSELGVMLPVYEAHRGTLESQLFYSRIKVFRNKQGIHFTRSINEQVTTIQGAFLQGPYFENFKIYHWGNLDLPPDKFELKKARNIILLQEVLKQYPDDFYYLYLIAKNYVDLKKYDQALTFLELIEKNDDIHKPEHVLEDYFRLRLLSLQGLERMDEYHSLLVALAAQQPTFFWVQWTYGYYLIRQGQFSQAKTIAEKVLSQPPPDYSSGGTSDLDSYYYWPHYLLGVIADVTKDFCGAKEHYQKALAFKYNDLLASRLKSFQGVV